MAQPTTTFLDEMMAAARGCVALLVGNRQAPSYFDFSQRGLVGSLIATLIAIALAGFGPLLTGVSLPAGSSVAIEVTELKRSEDAKTNIVMGFKVVSITANGRTYTPEAEVVTASIDRVRSQDRGDDAKKVVGGAAAGAIIGQVLGRDRKGTLIGAAVGAAAGAAAASSTSDYEGCVNAGSAIAVRLTGPLTVSVGN